MGAGKECGDRGIDERGAGGVTVAQPFALPCLSQISAFCALAARSPCICSLANIGVLRADRAQPLYLLTPPGRFGPSAQVPTGHTLPSGAPAGRCGPLAQQPTGLTLPFAPCRGLGQTPGRSIFAEGADRAHRSFRSPPSGRFATFGGKCPQGTRFPSVPQVLCRSTECKRFERPEVARNADGCSLYVFDLNLWRAGRVPKGTRRAAVAGRDGRARPAGRDSPEGAGARRWLDAQACGGGSRSAGPVAGYGLPGTTRRARLAGRGARDGTCRAGARRRLAARGRGGGSRSAGPAAGASAGASVGSAGRAGEGGPA